MCKCCIFYKTEMMDKNGILQKYYCLKIGTAIEDPTIICKYWMSSYEQALSKTRFKQAPKATEKRVRCKQNDCGRVFGSIEAMNSHWKDIHLKKKNYKRIKKGQDVRILEGNSNENGKNPFSTLQHYSKYDSDTAKD